MRDIWDCLSDIFCKEDFGICPLRTKEHPMGFTECPKNWYCRQKYSNDTRKLNPSHRNCVYI